MPTDLAKATHADEAAAVAKMNELWGGKKITEIALTYEN
jgi:hypothetical protein